MPRRNLAFGTLTLVTIVAANVVPRLLDLPEQAFLPTVAVFLALYAAAAYVVHRAFPDPRDPEDPGRRD